MTWVGWFLVAIIALDPLCRIVLIGESRKPITHMDALAGVLGAVLTIWLLVTIGSGKLGG